MLSVGNRYSAQAMTAVLALTGALIVGASDFAGGFAARRDPAVRVTAWIQAVSLALLTLALLPVGWTDVVTRDIVAGAIAGLSSMFSFIALYKSFTLGPISLMAPTAAVLSAIIPTGVGALRGETMSAVNLAGVVLSVIAIVLVSQDRLGVKDSSNLDSLPWSGFVLAALAGTGFSIFFLALAETNPDSGLWPLVIARLVSVPVVSLIAVVATGSLVVAKGNPHILALGGLGEALANICALIAYQRGPLSVAAVLSALFPVSTVLLARSILSEHLLPIQSIGVVMALGAIPLVVWP
jgi:drug/metabolite transporter (DMT)-like permease